MKALAFLLFLGCLPAHEPPTRIVIDPAMSPAERAVVLDAANAWCAAVGWCPREAMHADRGNFILVDALDQSNAQVHCPEGETCRVAAHNDGSNVVIVAGQKDLDRLWIAVAHEMGHFCTGHTETGLMAAVHAPGEPLEIDQVAIEAWKDGCGE